MNDWDEALAAELRRKAILDRADAGSIHRRARAANAVETIVRDARAIDTMAAAVVAIRWLSFDAIAAALAWSSTGDAVLAAGAAATLHLIGMCASSARAAQA